MPLIIPNQLPAAEALQSENIFTMERGRATTQDIRPLKIVIVNLMPTKIATETQLARVLSNTPLQVEMTLVTMGSHESTHISQEHMNSFYKTIDEIKDQYFDGMMLTGAPVEKMPYEQVDYWKELCEIFEFAKTHVYSTCLSAGAHRQHCIIITVLTNISWITRCLACLNIRCSGLIIRWLADSMNIFTLLIPDTRKCSERIFRMSRRCGSWLIRRKWVHISFPRKTDDRFSYWVTRSTIKVRWRVNTGGTLIKD